MLQIIIFNFILTFLMIVFPEIGEHVCFVANPYNFSLQEISQLIK